MKDFLNHHRPAVILMGIVCILTFVPVLDTFLILGNEWQGIMPTFIDENLYQAQVHMVAQGYIKGGNPYFLEHRFDPPLVIFGGVWINALPLLTGVSLNTALMINFVLWSLVFAALFYWLFRELAIPPWIAVVGTVLQYIQFYPYMWRTANLQPVLPFYILFYIAFVRLVREQNRRNIYMLAATIGISFYLFAYLWQIIVITLGLLFLYSLVRKNWLLMKATLTSSLIGGIVGLPVPLYMLWLSHSSPYFWESISRFGLVNTHLPMAEVLYSGGWIGVILAFLAVLYARVRTLREDNAFIQLGLFLALSGLGLWIMQGSNLFTGKLLETGEHIRVFIFPWLAFATVLLGTYLWKRRTNLTKVLQVFVFGVLAVCAVVSLRYARAAFSPFAHPGAYRDAWQTEQSYAKSFAWLDNQEENPIVVWNEPHDGYTPLLPVLTKHFVLFAAPAMWQLVSDSEFRERYLISQYFSNPTVASLKSDMGIYLGRQDLAHKAKTIERGIKICRILFFWDTNKDCGTPPTAIGLLGEKFFSDLEQKFQTDIKPNIKAYLKKYHVSYIIKDSVLNPQYHPEKLGATRVYNDGRFEIYRLP
ncbi:MAG: hypothetical protein AAB882_01455 [Patescibacteria group bacterium]